MALLALEFSTSLHSVAVHPGQGPIAESHFRPDPSLRSRQGIPASSLIEQTLLQAQIQRSHINTIALGLGPGSYTGIRVAIALAQGWELAQEGRTRILGIPSLDILAHTLFKQGIRSQVTLAFDAQKGELHVCTLNLGDPRSLWETRLKTPAWRTLPSAEWKSLLDQGEPVWGSDLQPLDARIQSVYPSATVLADLAVESPAYRDELRPGASWTPVYLRETTFTKVPPPPHHSFGDGPQ